MLLGSRRAGPGFSASLPMKLWPGSSLTTVTCCCWFACDDARPRSSAFGRYEQEGQLQLPRSSSTTAGYVHGALLVRCVTRCFPSVVGMLFFLCGRLRSSTGAILRCGDVVPVLVHDWFMVQTVLKSGRAAEEGRLFLGSCTSGAGPGACPEGHGAIISCICGGI